MKLLIGLVLLVAVAAVVALAWARHRWEAATHSLEQRLTVLAQPPAVQTYSESELSALPPPVARYLRLVLRDGQAVITHARITWAGEFNMGKPGADRWKPFTASQLFVPGAPGFVWDARVAMLPGVPVRVRDGFVDGAGSMHGAVAALLPVVRSEGTPEIAQAALQRYLGESIWVPTALLPSQGVRWSAIDASRAQATISGQGVQASVEFHFGADGLPAAIVVPQRLYDNGKDPPALFRWQARNLLWQPRDGIQVPAQAVAEWLLPAGRYEYWRGGPVAVQYQWAR